MGVRARLGRSVCNRTGYGGRDGEGLSRGICGSFGRSDGRSGGLN